MAVGAGFGGNLRNKKEAALARVRRAKEQFQSELKGTSREGGEMVCPRQLSEYESCLGRGSAFAA